MNFAIKLDENSTFIASSVLYLNKIEH